MVEREGALWLVLGSPGGPRIITSVLETITNIIDFDLSPPDAVAAPRFHQQWLPDLLYVERGGFPPETLKALAELGYELKEQSPWGAVELIAIGVDGNRLGVSDPRRPAGTAVGY
jgi:gamma-glutamyltranspeptidase/glutathione hydrolase